jgi:hypothetical protein
VNPGDPIWLRTEWLTWERARVVRLKNSRSVIVRLEGETSPLANIDVHPKQTRPVSAVEQLGDLTRKSQEPGRTDSDDRSEAD